MWDVMAFVCVCVTKPQDINNCHHEISSLGTAQECPYPLMFIKNCTSLALDAAPCLLCQATGDSDTFALSGNQFLLAHTAQPHWSLATDTCVRNG